MALQQGITENRLGVTVVHIGVLSLLGEHQHLMESTLALSGCLLFLSHGE